MLSVTTTENRHASHASSEATDINALKHELEVLADPHSPMADEMLTACYGGVRRAIEQNRQFRGLAQDFLEARNPLAPTHAAGLIFKSLQARLLADEVYSQYPNSFYYSEHTWQADIDRIMQDSHMRNEFTRDLAEKEQQSNIADRYIAPALIMALMPERLGDRPQMLDIGCSRNHGIKRLAFPELFNFAATAVKNARGDRDEILETKVNSLLHSNLGTGPSVGMDIREADPLWVYASSHYPLELIDPRRKEQYHTLEAIPLEDAGITTYQGDIADLDITDFETNSPVKKFDLVVLSTMIYELKGEKRSEAIKNALKLLKPEGVVVINEFARTGIANPSELQLYSSWFVRPFRYRTFVIDPLHDPNIPLEIFRFRNGRCRELMLGKDIDKLDASALVSLSREPSNSRFF